MNHEIEHQLREGRRLSLPRQGVSRSSGDTKPLKPRHEPLKGHEAYLEALRASGARIQIWPTGIDFRNQGICGTIKSADKFTISLLVDHGPNTNRTMVFFKHDIGCFSPVEKAA